MLRRVKRQPSRVQDNGDAKRYRTEIPNIVFTLGLTPFELALYVHLKKTAGEDGTCWKSTATLAKETGMSAGMVSKAKQGLLAPQTDLDGAPLIVISEETNPHGGKPRQLITLTDLWPANVNRFAKPSSPHEVASSYSERASSPHEVASSPHEIKKEPKKNINPNGAQAPVDSIWTAGVALLAMSGMAVREARSLLGGLSKKHGRAALIQAIATTTAVHPANPKDYLIKILVSPNPPRTLAELNRGGGGLVQ